MELLKVAGVSKKIGAKNVLKKVHFAQERFQKIAIAGETGSGKSTLLKTIAGLEQPDEGELHFEGIRIKGPDDQLVPGHPNIAYLSQHFELPKSLRVAQVLSYANSLESGAEQILYNVCRIDHLLDRKTDQLSGGERQRIALARLLSTSPKLLLLDEPFSNLDMVHKGVLKEVIKDVSEKLRITCSLVSHDPADTLSWADEIIVMREGQILQQGIPDVIYNRPNEEYTASLFGRFCKLGEVLTTAFSTYSKKLPTRKFFRPENFKLVDGDQQGVRGEVQQIRFYGGHSELDVRLLDQVIPVKTTRAAFQKGATVYVALR